MVFSPHFDDETLGCGGTLLKKRQLGADVKIVFLTDGSASHRDWIAESDLKTTRKREGIAAARALGIAASDVTCLGFAETKLAEYACEATRRTTELLRNFRPRDVYVPYVHDPPADHVATRSVVGAALRQYGASVRVYEYPIWFWQNWPWTSRGRSRTQPLRRAACQAVVAGVRMIRDFSHRVDIADVSDAKRDALDQHRSQTVRPDGQGDWPILSDVSEGDFLACFFQRFEPFVCRSSD